MKPNDFLLIISRSVVLVGALIWAGTSFAGTTYKVIYSFQGGTDGAVPSAPLIADRAGNLYGTTQSGGSSNCFDGCGTVFQLTPPAKSGGAWTESVIYRFTGGYSGSIPFLAPLVFDHAGNLYGTASNTVFELSPPAQQGEPWSETVLYIFTNGNDGGQPNGVIFDGAGNLYGTTQTGGAYGPLQGAGTVFELNRPQAKAGAWSETTLYSFQLVGDGNQPGIPVFDANGSLYATNKGNSVTCTPKYPFQCGVVFELQAPAQPGGAWVYNIIHTFQGFDDASYPNFSAPLFDQSGNLYLTTEGSGGSGNINFENPQGAVVQFAPPIVAGGSWTETFLHNFPRPGGIDGSYPTGTVVFDPSGNLYGVTFSGAGHTRVPCAYRGCGSVFELKPPAAKTAHWREVQLHAFTSTSDGNNPDSGLLLDSEGALFGPTAFGGGSSACTGGCGTVFELLP